MPKQIRRLRPSGGLISDILAWEVGDDYYTRLRNVLMRSGFATRVPGSRQAYDGLSTSPLHIQNVAPLGINYWVYFGSDEIFAVDGALVHSDLSPTLTPVASPYQWSTTALNGIPCANNTVDEPMYWDGDVSHNYATLTDWPSGVTADFITAHRFHLFAFSITDSVKNPHLVMWSDAAEPGAIPASWTPAADNEAGSASLSQTPGRIVTAKTLRDSLLVYKNSSAYAFDYTGDPISAFSVRGLWSRAGALTPHSVADINGKHIVVSDGDILLNDGFSEPQSIANFKVRRFLFDQLDPTNYQNLFVVYNPTFGEVWIFFPQTGSEFSSVALVWNIQSDSWGYVEAENPTAHASTGSLNDEEPSTAWEDDDEAWEDDDTPWFSINITSATESLLLAEPTTDMLRVLGVSTPTARNGLIAHYGLPFDDPERIKFIRQAHIRGSFGTLYVRVGSQMFPDGPTTWSTEVTVTSPTQPIPLFTQGRFISYEVRSTDTVQWIVTGIDFEYEMRGYF